MTWPLDTLPAPARVGTEITSYSRSWRSAPSTHPPAALVAGRAAFIQQGHEYSGLWGTST
jgi:hypothetical protein